MAFRPDLQRRASRAEDSRAKKDKLLMPPWMRTNEQMRPKKEGESPEEIKARGLEMLTSMFPRWEKESLLTILEAHNCVIDDTITTVLRMEEDEEEESKRLNRIETLPKESHYVPKHPIPDDFLRVPGEELDHDSESEDTMRESMDEFDPFATLSSSRTLTPADSKIAEDDGTVYGKEFDSATDDTVKTIETQDDQPLVAPNVKMTAFIDPNATPESLQQKKTRPKSRTDNLFAQLTVIKRSKLDIVGAEDRIRHREPHRVLDCLNKASALYRNGVITNYELETLRSLILCKMQPTKMLMDASVNMNSETITDHEWNCLVFKSKGIRQALSIRIIKTLMVSQHAEYEIRTNDLETGVVVVTRKRFRELYKLHRKLCPLSTRISSFPFPTRHSVSKKEDLRLAAERQPQLEEYLRLVASLVAPSPLTNDRGNALKQLQVFLNLPHGTTLESKATLPWSRALRVYVFHILNDITSPEGKVCRKFKQQSIRSPAFLEDMGDILDNIQSYMLEHRYEDMKALVCPSYSTDEDIIHDWISDAIRHEIEEWICVPMLPTIWSIIERDLAPKERQLKDHIAQLRSKPQSFYGIPLESISVSSWARVIDTMKDIDMMTLPLDKLRKLVESAMMIHIVFQEEHDGKGVLSGDDFLPIFIYVIVQSRLSNPLVLLRVLNVLSDPEKRVGQNGYYLASYEAALEHLISPENIEALAN